MAKQRSRLLILAAVASLSFLAGCGGKDKDAVAPTATTQEASFAAAPWLRQHLPDDTIAYLRLPSLWGLLSAPNQRAADAMYGNPAHDQVIAQLRQALASNVITAHVVGSDSVDRVLRALSSVQAPVEIAFTAPGKMLSPSLTALVSTAFESRDAEVVATVLDALLANAGTAPVRFDADGWADLSSPLGTSAAAHFDRHSGRLSIVAGANVTRAPLQALLDGARDNGPGSHALHTLEQEIDAGGQGLLLWLDVQAGKPFMLATLTPETLPLRHVYNQTRAVALGWGGVNGHGRLSLRAELENPTWMRYLPQAPRKFDLKTVGEPGSVITLALPSAADLERILGAIGEDFGVEARQRWEAFDSNIRQESGLGLGDWLAPYGNELVLFDDAAGSFSAIRLRDRAAWTANIEQLGSRSSQHTTRTINGTAIHHLRAQWTDRPDENHRPAMAGAALLQWWLTLPSHLYWIEDGDWLISSAVPQPLIDRIAMKATQPVDAWLRERQGDDRSQALLSLSTRVDGVPRSIYARYLGLLAAIGDMANSPVDLFALPTARQLGLPERTGIGLQLIASDDRAGFDLNFQSTPLDGVMSGAGTYGAIAVVAIMAAIAMPAYNDYLARARISEAVAATQSLQMMMADHFAATGALPSPAELAGMRDALPVTGFADIQPERDGRLRIHFNEHANISLRGHQLTLVPHRSADGILLFVCGRAAPPPGARPLAGADAAAATDVPEKLLPAHCRARN